MVSRIVMFNNLTEIQRYLDTKRANGLMEAVSSKAESSISNRLEKVGHCGITKIDMSAEDCPYDTVYQVNYSYRLPKKVKRPLLVLVGINTETQALSLIGLAKSYNYFDRLTPKQIATLLNENEQKPFRQMLVEQLPKKYKFSGDRTESLPSQFRIPSLEDLDILTAHKIKLSMGYFENDLKTFENKKTGKKKETLIRSLILDSQNALEQEKEAFLNNVSANHLNSYIYDWAKETFSTFFETTGLSYPYTTVELYNHILSAPDHMAVINRYVAVEQFSALGNLFLDQDIWEAIDQGSRPINTLAKVLDVKPATLKRLAKEKETFISNHDHTPDRTIQYAQWLDKIDPKFWPQDKEQCFYFDLFMNTAELIKDHCHIEPSDFTKYSIRSHKNAVQTSGVFSWQQFFFETFKEQLETVVKEPGFYLSYPKMTDKMRRKVKRLTPPETIEKMNDIPEIYRNYAPFWEGTRKVLRRTLRDVMDMKKDVEQKILTPAILLSAEQNNVQFVDEDLLENVSENLRPRLWGNFSVKDQIALSNYWHSERVNIRTRFKSAVLGESIHNSWPGLIEEPMTLENGIVIHPLTTSAELEEESKYMKHCVWSYTKNCLEDNYHIFSLRQENGKRVSTLSLRDTFNDQNKRHMIHNQNRGVKNATPSDQAKQAAEMLLKMVNKGEIKPNWEKIDAHRAEYGSKKIEQAAGYDFRDVAQRNSVFRVYSPCLPKRKATSFDEFMTKSHIRAEVETFISGYDFTQGGIIPLEPQALAV